jgi:hypothetical protein
MVVENHEINKHSTQFGENVDIKYQSHNKKVEVGGRKNETRNIMQVIRANK